MLNRPVNSTNKSEDFSKNLQYKVPINVGRQNRQIASSRENLPKRNPQNIFAVRQQGE